MLDGLLSGLEIRDYRIGKKKEKGQQFSAFIKASFQGY